MAKRQPRWTPAQAQRVVDDYERSGLTLQQFAKTRNLRPDRIRVWQRRLQQEASVEVPRMVELIVEAPPQTHGSMKLCCPSGHVIELNDVDLSVGVRALIDALPGGARC